MLLNRMQDAIGPVWSIYEIYRSSICTKPNKFIDITKWSYNKFSREAFDCFEYDAEYTNKYCGISDINYECDIRFKSVVDILHRRKIKKKRMSQFKRGF